VVPPDPTVVRAVTRIRGGGRVGGALGCDHSVISNSRERRDLDHSKRLDRMEQCRSVPRAPRHAALTSRRSLVRARHPRRKMAGRARNESCGFDSRALASQRAASWFVQWPVGLAAQPGWSVAERAHFVHMCGVVEPRDPDQVVARGASTECKRSRHGDGSPSGDRLERARGA
jgi:hypothetical protein